MIQPLKDLGRKKGQKDPNSLKSNLKESMGKQDTAKNKRD